ncbi:2-amino-3-ketobutyrate CoA ligase [Legionella busanensis]|uniref:2-amino-3-ketobutyrate CoA ligase n=1 Tax=Legionella busanensis TaxID=190655 RepID=A0A378JKC8_9GAMM|nr:pyridoxal phosphate-dependent aminotransferase family protein [Legionella busanensis]STX50773.1 2-amino-3-ketobutyrate CoA ligase [Legionella busanensis]
MIKKGDIFSKCYDDKSGFFSNVKALLSQYQQLPELSGSIGAHMLCNGKEVINWSSNDYLGLTNHPSNRAIERQVINEGPANLPMGSRFLTNNSAFKEFEAKFASFIHCQSSMVFSTGYLAAIGVIPALSGPGDIILIDAEAHSCLFDAVKLAISNGALYKVFRHNDMESLEAFLKLAREKAEAGIMIICDGVYSMKGDLAKLKEIITLKEKYGARLFLDDSHGGGVMGLHGRGTAHHFNVANEVDLVLHTFSKAFGAVGGCISGNKEIIDYLRRSAKTYIFSHSMQLIFMKKILNSLELILANSDFLRSLWRNTELLQFGLQNAGFNIGDTQSPITPVTMQVIEQKTSMRYLFHFVSILREEHQIYVSAVTYPAVPSNKALIRLIPTAGHSIQDIEKTIKAFVEVRHKLGSYPLS